MDVKAAGTQSQPHVTSSATSTAAAVSGWNRVGFASLWLSQTLTLFGAQTLSFALGVWVFVGTGSLSQFAAIFAVQFLPGIVFAPFLGVLIDRIHRQRMLAGALIVQIAAVFVVWLLTRAGAPQLWLLAVLMFVAATAATAQQLAFSASVPLLVPRQQLGHANGLVQISTQGAPVLAPIVGALAFDRFGVGAVILIHLAMLTAALFALIAVRLPAPGVLTRRAGAWAELEQAWRFIRSRRGLMSLLVFMAVNAFSIGCVQILFRPMVLTVSSASVLGVLLSCSAGAGIGGALMMTVWGGPKRLIHGVVGSTFIAGLCMAVIGWNPNVISIGVAAAVFSLVMPIVMGCSQTIWHGSVPHEMQGRVLAFRQMISTGFLPLAILVSPLLVERVLDPMLRAGGPLATITTDWLGPGPTRGMALLFLAMGIVVMLVAVFAMRHRALMQVDSHSLSAPTPEPRVT